MNLVPLGGKCIELGVGFFNSDVWSKKVLGKE